MSPAPGSNSVPGGQTTYPHKALLHQLEQFPLDTQCYALDANSNCVLLDLQDGEPPSWWPWANVELVEAFP